MPTQFDAAITLQLDIQRVSASVQSKAVAILRKLEKELIGITIATEWKRARVERQLKEARQAISDYYNKAGTMAAESSGSIAAISAKATTVAIGTAAVLPSAAMIQSIAGNAVVQGAVQTAWWSKQSTDTAFKYAQAVRQGLVSAETNQQIVRRVLDVMEISRANAAALVQTSVATVANDARMMVMKANDDIIKRYRAVATLDTKTCSQCAPLDGLEWDTQGKPIGHSVSLPSYPLHYNCRCLLIPRITTEAPGGKRASSGGPVSADLTFEGWLDRQSKAKQIETLGKGRAELYRSGKITISDLTNGNGNPLTISQLEKKYT